MNEPVEVWREAFSARGERHRIGAHATRAAALAAAMSRLDEDLRHLHAPGMDALTLFQHWSVFGDDLFLVPDGGRAPFSALDAARLRSVAVSGDTTRPLLLRAECADRFNTASGAPSAEGRWVFHIRAPATCHGAERVLRAAVEALYADMNTRAEDGSYTLLRCVFVAAPDDAALKQVFGLETDGRLTPQTPAR